MGGLMPDRRAFLRSLVSGSAGFSLGAELDIERLLWVPKSIVTVPSMYGRGNRLVTFEWVMQDVMAHLRQKGLLV